MTTVCVFLRGERGKRLFASTGDHPPAEPQCRPSGCLQDYFRVHRSDSLEGSSSDGGAREYSAIDQLNFSALLWGVSLCMFEKIEGTCVTRAVATV